MRTILWIKGERGLCVLRRLIKEEIVPVAMVLQDQPETAWYKDASRLAKQYVIPKCSPSDPNDPMVAEELRTYQPDVFVLAGYGGILTEATISIPKVDCINLHGGALPGQRGSAPLNWVLLHGRDEFGISIIRVDAGVDTGDVLLQRRFSIAETDTIATLHERANSEFSEMVVEVLRDIGAGTHEAVAQDPAYAAYYPARFPEDGLVMFDMLTAAQVHDLVRALSDPYPGAYTYFRGRRIRLLSSRLRELDYYGVPGRVYMVREGSLLVCAQDKCLWIDKAVFDDDGTDVVQSIQRYDRLATVQQAAELMFASLGGKS